MAENNSSAPLLPCPFCGATAAVQNESPADNSGGYFVECKSCGASTNLRYACGDDPLPLLVAQWNARAPSKTAEEAAHQLLIALRTIAAYPVTNLLMNMDAANMQRIAVRALEAQAATAAVAVPGEREAYSDWLSGSHPRVFSKTDAEAYWRNKHVSALAWQARAALAATPALPATENSSAGGLTEAGRTGLSAFLDAAKSAGITHLPGAKELAARFDQAEPFGYVNVYTGQFFNDVEPCRKNNGGHWRTVYTAPQAQPADALDAAARDVLAERRRQVEVEGFTYSHDDSYTDGELAQAAACYAASSQSRDISYMSHLWPWPNHTWKPSTTRKDLLKAGALILAELERINRARAAMAAAQEGGNAAKEV